MKQYLRSLLAFFLIFIAIRVVVLQFLPYHWGNPWFSTKIRFLEEKNEHPEMVFIGSSRVYRHIDPSIFDSLMVSSGRNSFSSFNLGAPATFPPQTYYLMNQFLHSDLASGTKYVLLELEDILPLGNRHQERTSYWIQPGELGMVLKSTLGRKDLKLIGKLRIIGGYLEAYSEKIFGIGHFRNQIKETDYYTRVYVGSKQKGYLPLDEEFSLTNREGLLDRFQKIDSNILKERYEKANTALAKPNSLDKVHLNYLKNLVEETKSRQIRIIFMISPRNANSYILSLAEELKKENIVVDLSKNPNFYNAGLSADNGHLNAAGATLFTRELYEKCAGYLKP